MQRLLLLLSALIFSTTVWTQDISSWQSHSFAVDNLEDGAVKDFFNPLLAETQFIMVGEQHFIQEVGEVTKVIYQLAEAFDYRTLCIENDALMAEQIAKMASAADPIKAAREFYQQFPTSVAFYENPDDYELLSYVAKNGGQFWGIDQTLMAQFRFNFSYLLANTKDAAFAERLKGLVDTATTAYKTAIANNDFQACYYFRYNEQVNNELLQLAPTAQEREIIFQLGKTKEIYDYNFSGQYYLNNEIRGRLMKSNFMRYYRAAQEETPLPKVVFKLGSYHTYRGLTPTRIYDVSNLVTELANMNGKRSLHLRVLGISGQQRVGFPFAPEPIVSFDNTADFPAEIQEWLVTQPEEKYLFLHLEPLRPQARQYSEAMQKLMFAHDVLVLARDAQAVSAFD
ncbi:MAG: hypothetical protein AAFO02_05845 [Bacteroidota bacterium]